MHTNTFIKELLASDDFISEIIDIRRELHAHPELSGREFETMEHIGRILSSFCIPYTKGVGGTGIKATLLGNAPGKHVALRADMDALPSTEKTGLPYASTNVGIMHACGHDIHMAILLGVAKAFASMKGEYAGSITFIFQPNEEGTGGALPMINEGVLDGVDYVLGLHVDPRFKVGQVGIKYGKVHAASDMFTINISGKSSHGAEPQHGTDAIVIAAQIINALQTIVSRNIAPVDSAVVTVGKVVAGTAFNLVAESATCIGTTRTLSPDSRGFVLDRIRTISESIASSMGGSATLQVDPSYDPLIVDEKVTDVVRNVARDIYGADSIIIEETPQLTVEDFAFFAREKPAAYYHLGCSPVDGPACPALHNSSFCPDEGCIAVGIRLQAETALSLMGA